MLARDIKLVIKFLFNIPGKGENKNHLFEIITLPNQKLGRDIKLHTVLTRIALKATCRGFCDM